MLSRSSSLIFRMCVCVFCFQPSVWKAWEGLEEGAKLGELVVKTVKRKKPDGSVVEEQTMQVKPGVSRVAGEAPECCGCGGVCVLLGMRVFL